MTDPIDELLERLERGEPIDPQKLSQTLNDPEGIRRLRCFLEIRGLFSNLPDDEEDTPVPIDFSFKELADFLERGTLDDPQRDEAARKVIDHYFPLPDDRANSKME